MADSTTAKLGLVKPADHEEAGAELWGLKINADLDVIDRAVFSHHFAEDPASHSGLAFAYKGGVVRQGIIISLTAAGTAALADNTTNYIEVDPADGTISANAVGFTAKRIPLFTAVTAAGAITAVTDKRAFLGLDDNPPDVLAAKGDMLAFDGSDYQAVAAGADGEMLIADSGEANGVRWGTIIGGIAYYIDDTLAVDTEVMSFIAPCPMTILDVLLKVDTAPTGASLIIDIHLNGTTVFTTQANRPTITAGNTSATSAAPDVAAIAAGDKATLEIDQIGSTVAGKNLSVLVRCQRGAG